MTSLEDVRSVVARETGLPEKDIHPETPLRSLIVDSLEMASLILELEDVVGHEIPDHDAQKLLTVADVVKYAAA